MQREGALSVVLTRGGLFFYIKMDHLVCFLSGMQVRRCVSVAPPLFFFVPLPYYGFHFIDYCPFVFNIP